MLVTLRPWTIHQLKFALYACTIVFIYISYKVMTLKLNYEPTKKQHFLKENETVRKNVTLKRQEGYKKNYEKIGPVQRQHHRLAFQPTVVKGRDINPQIFEFFQLKENEPKDPFVNLHSYKFTLNSEVCNSGNTFLVVIIHSAPMYFRRRHLIRTTFGSVDLYRQRNIATVFMIGAVMKVSVQEELTEESSKYGDIVQGNFLDRYKNLTKKHIMAMHWFKYNCKAEYILKLDDDTFINPYRMIDYILSVKPVGRGIWCKVMVGQGPVRTTGSKWFTSKSQYPFPILPPFCLGFAYLTTPETWEILYNTSETNRPMNMDDVYVSVILAMKANVRKTDFGNILLPCPSDKIFNAIDLNRKAIVIDRGGHCADIPFGTWRYIRKPDRNK